MKKISAILLSFILATTMLFAVPVFAEDGTGSPDQDPTAADTTYEPQLGTNGKAALAYFGVDKHNVFEVSSTAGSNDIRTLITAVKTDATSSSPVMIYVKSGTHTLTYSLGIPENVIFVAENGVVFKRAFSDKMVKLKGSLYGGTWDGGNIAQNIIQMVNTNTTGKNMTVMKAVIRNTKMDGVHINDRPVKHGKVLNNTITNCKHNGVSVYNGGQFDTISGNTITNIGKTSTKNGSAIDICSSNAATISNNKISNVVGHGISTDPVSSNGRYGCKITTISGNTIKNVKHQGVYIENRCSVTKFYNNKISNVQGCCLTVDKNAKVYAMSGNRLSGKGSLSKKGKHSIVTLNGKGAYIKIGKNNKIYNGYAAGIALSKKAKVDITGNGNQITHCKKNGIQLAAGSKLKITGKTKITNNRWGINTSGKASISIKKTTIKSNKKGAIYYLRGTKLKRSGCSIKGQVYKAK